jgi:hypothetical protein
MLGNKMDRIDELIRQATHDCMGVPVLDKRQLAQLIVQECAEVVDWAISVDSTIDRVPVLIREHFGVE